MTMDTLTLECGHKGRTVFVKMFDVFAHETQFTVVAQSSWIRPTEAAVEINIRNGGLSARMQIRPDAAREIATALLESAAEAERIDAEAAQ